MTARRLKVVEDVAPRFGIGVRVSRVGGRGGERFLSPDIQIKGATRAIEAAGGVVDVTVGADGVFYDLDVSGAVAPSDRPGLGEALELVRAGQLQGVAVYDLSRWSRETVSGLRELEEVAAAGGTVLSASESIDIETPAGIFSTTVQLAAHRLRRDEASRSWKATHARRFEMGLPHGKLPYGYVSVDGRPVADAILGPAVTRAFEDYAARAVTQKTLAERLGALRGKPMRQGTVSSLLRNRFYIGELEFLGETKTGVHEPLVSLELFAEVRDRLNWERQAGPHWRAPGSPIIGLVFCGVCGRPLYRCGTGARGGKPRAPRVICAGVNQRVCDGIGTPSLPELELAVRDFALRRARGMVDTAAERVRRETQKARVDATVTRLEGEQVGLLNDLGELAAAKARKVMSDRAYAAAAGPIEEALDRIDAQLVELRGMRREATVTVVELESAAAQIEALWPEYTPIEARAALRVLLPRGVRVGRASYRGQDVGERLTLPEE